MSTSIKEAKIGVVGMGHVGEYKCFRNSGNFYHLLIIFERYCGDKQFTEAWLSTKVDIL